ncbi:DUF1206 domain-containing protein [Pontibacter liquoris]|uniref:DUF1206 domain-containing protein n=1 Tax=Pontibacter liquoris TaxID=2905677 RepID=UPI001FA7591A|nr:DUF1206 domain-containing protein [Pontibacter liquoris]
MNISAHVPAPPPKWVESFARFGLTAKGVVYCLVGILAFMAAFELGNKSSEDAGKSGVFQFIQQQPFGKVLLAIVALGLFSYSIWRLIGAIKDTENKGTGVKGIGVRLRYAFSGLVYGALAFLAAKMVVGAGGSSGGDDSRQTLARELLQQPFGQWLVGILAVGTAIAGVYQIYLGLSDKYKMKVQQAGLAHQHERTMIRAGKIGYVARGIVWLVIGYLFLKAALTANAKEAGGTDNAFQWLEASSYGSYLLGAVALGLICYGVFMFMRAKYQAINGG